ncbi:MAG: flippase-like domain-containing protein [Rhodospirillaceae bacterium]|nr:flippase-like domain-containing protein [Rhodospirillaceae bacterium]
MSPTMTSLHKSKHWRRFALILISVLLIAATLRRINIADAMALAKELSWIDLILASSLMILNQIISSVRYFVLSRSFGLTQSFARAHRTNIFSIAGSLLFFNLLGQSLTRSSMLRRDHKPAIYGVLITVVERVISLLSLLIIVAVCSFAYFGTISLNPKTQALAIAGSLTITAASVIALFYGLPSRYRLVLKRFLIPRSLGALVMVSGLSLSMHITMMLAYVALASAIVPSASIFALVLTASLVMLGASLPISFGGWGIREFTASYAFAYVGMASEAGVAMALGVGILSTLALLVNVAALSFRRPLLPFNEPTTTTPQVRPNITALLTWLIPVGCAVLLGFQVKVPTNSGFLSVNLADVVAVCGGLLLIFSIPLHNRPPTLWKIPGLGLSLAMIAAVLVLSFIIGWQRLGFVPWAFFNRLIGAGVLCGYLFCGTLIVTKDGTRGLETLARCYILTIVTILVAEWIMHTLDPYIGNPFKSPFNANYIGFVDNPNLLSFQVLIAMVLLLSGVATWERSPAWLPPAISAVLFAGTLHANSRSGYIATLLIIAFLLLVQKIRVRPRLLLLGIAVYGASLIPEITYNLFLSTGIKVGSINNHILSRPEDMFAVTGDRMSSYLGALKLWWAHPIFGAGLGAFIADHIARTGEPLVIHDSYLWILTELGLVGLAAFILPPLLILRTVAKDPNWIRHTPTLGIIGCFLVIGTMSILHDMIYQRPFWLMMGALLTIPNVLRRPA